MAKRREVAAYEPLQMGFGFEVSDREGRTPGFLHRPEDVYAALDVIQQALWGSADVETTGLTDASIPVDLDPKLRKQDASSRVRMRTIQIRVPTERGRYGTRANFAFDCDRMPKSLTQEVAATVLSRPLLIAHNAGFDTYWLRLADGRIHMPKMVADTMLLTRLLKPLNVLKRVEMVSNVQLASMIELESPEVQAAWQSLVSGASGGSLADVVLSMFGVLLDKSFQHPRNWTGHLGFGHYDYAIDDTVWADRIACKIFDIPEDGDLYQAYLGLRARKETVRLLEPQVPELVQMREHGMPINQEVGLLYVARKRKELAVRVDELIAVEPALNQHRDSLADPDAGIDDELKKALAIAFTGRGVPLRKTKTGAPQVGEKDLRACRAAQIEMSRPLFNAWVAVCRAKKTSAMAFEVVGFARRSPDGKVRSLLSHGPVTGRLAAQEPNCQQFPRDQLFRAMCISPTLPGRESAIVEVNEVNQGLMTAVMGRPTTIGEVCQVSTPWLTAMFWSDKSVFTWPADEKARFSTWLDTHFSHTVVSCDFGALDVRVGAALCIRSQRQMLALAKGHAVPGPVQPPEGVVDTILEIVPLLDEPDAVVRLQEKCTVFQKQVIRLEQQLKDIKTDFDTGALEKKRYWRLRSDTKNALLPAKLGWRLAQCLALGAERSEREYSALRDAFVKDIDIHTFTGMKLIGRDPIKEFAGLTHAEVKELEKKLKKELGARRQQGKIANLSLLYGMAEAGFQEAAARGYDEHWSLEQTEEIRDLWLDAYPEVELWHLWTECLQSGTVYIPERGKDKPVRTGWWVATTLAGRDIVAFGLNAALSYQDQSTGADILGLIMHRLATEYPQVFLWAVNQIHDEIVFAWPSEYHEAYLAIAEMVMVEEANRILMPYGVPAAIGPASGPLWIKD